MIRKPRCPGFLLFWASLATFGAAAAQGTPTVTAALTMDGREIYLDGCATCHGADGRGMDRALLAFEEELPDFTDCSFASREPAADWVIVAQRGGPVRGFSEMMPSFDAAYTTGWRGEVTLWSRRNAAYAASPWPAFGVPTKFGLELTMSPSLLVWRRRKSPAATPSFVDEPRR